MICKTGLASVGFAPDAGQVIKHASVGFAPDAGHTTIEYASVHATVGLAPDAGYLAGFPPRAGHAQRMAGFAPSPGYAIHKVMCTPNIHAMIVGFAPDAGQIIQHAIVGFAPYAGHGAGITTGASFKRDGHGAANWR